jgi:glycosyltransferase involved in cell wall biosynthesis
MSNPFEPLVTVIIPAYNHEKYVGPAVESVLNQSYSHLELIVIDDGSTDHTADVISTYNDARLRYLYQENQDAFNTINRGLELAQGKFIAILNSDDVYTPERLAYLLDLQKSSKAEFIFTDVIPIDAGGTPILDPDHPWNVWHQKNRRFYFECGNLYTAFLKGNFMVTTSNVFMSRRAYEQVGQFCSLRYLHDYDYIFRVMLAFPDKVHYAPDAKLLHYRIHGANTLGEAAIIGREQDKAVIRKYMLAKVSSTQRPFVRAGADRLVELEKELFEINLQLGEGHPSIKAQLKALLKNIRCRIKAVR